MTPAELAVLMARLTGIATEMGEVLRRGAFSPNIKERADCSAALFTADCTLLVQAEHIPVHLGSMPASVRAAVAALGDRVGPGDQIVLNDPFAGGTHLNDVTLVAPVFAESRGARGGVGGSGAAGVAVDPEWGIDAPDGEFPGPNREGGGGARPRLLGWVANRAHHADLGGAAPGSMPASATEIHQEGLRLPPMLVTPEVIAVMVASSRTPDERGGDIDAQIGANRVGARRLADLVADWPDLAPLAEVVGYGERRMRAALAELPRGRWQFEDVLDSFGPEPHQQEPTPVRVTLTVDDDGVCFDFTGTGPQRRGNVNAVEAVTVSAVAWALRSVLAADLPTNGGTMRPVRVVAPAGTVVAASYPAAVGAGNVEVSQRVADVCLGVLAQVLPMRVPAASQGTMNNVLIGGDGWVSYETIAGGQGGRPPRPDPAAGIAALVDSPRSATPGQSGIHTAMTNTVDERHQSMSGIPGQSGIQTGMTNTDQFDYRSAEPRPGQSGIHTAMTNTDQVDYRSGEPCPGQSGIHTAMTNTRNTPIEALERAFPLRVLRYRLRWGSGGAGWSAGGEGIERDLQVLEDATVSLITERRVSRPWGLVGGGHGSVGENWLLPGGDESRAERLPDKCTIQLRAGDVVRMLTPGGGGWGAAAATRTGRQGSSPLRSA